MNDEILKLGACEGRCLSHDVRPHRSLVFFLRLAPWCQILQFDAILFVKLFFARYLSHLHSCSLPEKKIDTS